MADFRNQDKISPKEEGQSPILNCTKAFLTTGPIFYLFLCLGILIDGADQNNIPKISNKACYKYIYFYVGAYIQYRQTTCYE